MEIKENHTPTNGNGLEERIVDAAKRLFAERGFENTSMSDIAAEAGINRPTLHYYFRTKEKMFEAVFGLLIQELIPRIESIFAAETPIMQKFEHLTDAYIGIYLANPYLPRFVLGEVQRDTRHLLDVMRRLNIDRYAMMMRDSFLAEAERGTIRAVSPAIAISTFFGQLTFPFLAKNLLVELLVKDEAGFAAFIDEWKGQVMHQMRTLLQPD